MERNAGGRGKSVVVVTTTLPKPADARRMAARIVESRLGACVQTMPIRSLYRWKGRVESAGEVLLAVKTRAGLAGRLVAFIRKEHSYEVPEILVMPVRGGLPEYLDWICRETG